MTRRATPTDPVETLRTVLATLVEAQGKLTDEHCPRLRKEMQKTLMYLGGVVNKLAALKKNTESPEHSDGEAGKRKRLDSTSQNSNKMLETLNAQILALMESASEYGEYSTKLGHQKRDLSERAYTAAHIELRRRDITGRDLAKLEEIVAERILWEEDGVEREELDAISGLLKQGAEYRKQAELNMDASDQATEALDGIELAARQLASILNTKDTGQPAPKGNNRHGR